MHAVSTTIKWCGVSDFKSMKWPLKPGLPMTNKQNYGFTSYQLRGSLNTIHRKHWGRQLLGGGGAIVGE